MVSLSIIRLALYCILWIFSAALLGLTAARIHYTENLSPDDPLNGGHHFYEPVVAELLATGIIAMLWSMFVILAIYMQRVHLIIHTFAAETIALFVLFVMWLVGTGIATSMWGNLGWCHQYSPCRLLTALVAIAWTGFVFLFFLLGVSLLHILAVRARTEILQFLRPPNSFVPAQTSEYHGNHA
ncbi:hypothetical protein BJY52DRAFT_449236 [Lactarius psammicola]|nr:hypothetical protein BJY52DRAFT_449236 [Lactarius psammicola]